MMSPQKPLARSKLSSEVSGSAQSLAKMMDVSLSLMLALKESAAVLD
jgi:hypothetical protein